VRDDDAVATSVDTIAGRRGSLDVVVNNAEGLRYSECAEALGELIPVQPPVTNHPRG
jgi:NAD(P)-dependent dehydrogenase (short-subunit alcohol dehydrogenase family)